MKMQVLNVFFYVYLEKRTHFLSFKQLMNNMDFKQIIFKYFFLLCMELRSILILIDKKSLRNYVHMRTQYWKIM